MDPTHLKQAHSDMEDEQDPNIPRLTYFAAVSKSLPDLASRPGAWQSSKVLSSSALLANELLVLGDLSQSKVFDESESTCVLRDKLSVPEPRCSLGQY